MLSLYEKKVAGEFDKIEPLAQELASHGKVSADSKTLLSKIGHMLLIEHCMVGLISDTAQTLADVWDNKQLHKLDWYIIGLIVFEIVIILFEMADRFLH